jgi:hypothetical protein
MTDEPRGSRYEATDADQECHDDGEHPAILIVA